MRNNTLMRLRARHPMQRYIDRQWRYNRRIVCIAAHCWRMIGEDCALHCATHAARYE